MKIKINKDVIKSYNPCKERFDNYLESYSNFNGDIQDFLDLTNISHHDKLWVTCHILPRSILEVFAIDCAFSAANAANAYYANAAANAAYYAAEATNYYAANAAYYANAAICATEAAYYATYVARKEEQDNQIAILKYLISEEK
jgi:hypothetical protein